MNEVSYHQLPQFKWKLMIGQIYSRMLHGVILPGEQRFNKEHWADNILNKCFFDNHLWGDTPFML